MARTATVIPFTKPRQRRRPSLRLIVNHDARKDRLIFEVQRALKGLTYKEMCEGTETDNKQKKPVAINTVRKWWIPVDKGGTRYPRAHTMDRILMAHGLKLGIVQA